jgi:transcriptional regulator with XRE-family HTH domain
MSENSPGYGRLGQIVDLWMEAQPIKPSVAGVAKALGRTRQTVGKWMKAESVPSPADLRALSQLIDVPQRQLLEAIWLDKGYDPEDLLPDNDVETNRATG